MNLGEIASVKVVINESDESSTDEECKCKRFIDVIGRSADIAGRIVSECEQNSLSSVHVWEDAIGSGYLMVSMGGISESDINRRPPMMSSSKMKDSQIIESMKSVASGLVKKHAMLSLVVDGGGCPCSLAMECIADQAVFSSRLGEYSKRMTGKGAHVSVPWASDSNLSWTVLESDDGAEYISEADGGFSVEDDLKMVIEVAKQALRADYTKKRVLRMHVALITLLYAFASIDDIEKVDKRKTATALKKGLKDVFGS